MTGLFLPLMTLIALITVPAASAQCSNCTPRPNKWPPLKSGGKTAAKSYKRESPAEDLYSRITASACRGIGIAGYLNYLSEAKYPSNPKDKNAKIEKVERALSQQLSMAPTEQSELQDLTRKIATELAPAVERQVTGEADLIAAINNNGVLRPVVLIKRDEDIGLEHELKDVPMIEVPRLLLRKSMQSSCKIGFNGLGSQDLKVTIKIIHRDPISGQVVNLETEAKFISFSKRPCGR